MFMEHGYGTSALWYIYEYYCCTKVHYVSTFPIVELTTHHKVVAQKDAQIHVLYSGNSCIGQPISSLLFEKDLTLDLKLNLFIETPPINVKVVGSKFNPNGLNQTQT